MKKLIVFIAAMALSGAASAACDVKRMNGVWRGNYTSTIPGIGVCQIIIRGNKLGANSWCTDSNFDQIKVTNGQVKRDAQQCEAEIQFRHSGERAISFLTFDRGVTVATGVYLTDFYSGTFNLVKK